jgi:Zn-dependent peptidase ImmA (M78 family)
MNLLYEAMCSGLLGFNKKAYGFADAKEICKKQHIWLIVCEYGPDVLGYFCVRRTEKRFKKFIMVNSILNNVDRTFTLLHELGHFFLHKPVRADHYFYCSRNAKLIQQKHDAEADAFALIAMIPFDLMLELYHTPFTEIEPALLPYLRRRYKLWQDFGV